MNQLDDIEQVTSFQIGVSVLARLMTAKVFLFEQAVDTFGLEAVTEPSISPELTYEKPAPA